MRGVVGVWGCRYEVIKMATEKTDLTKFEKNRKEANRIKKIFKELDENKKKLVTPLIDKAAFMSVTLDELQ